MTQPYGQQPPTPTPPTPYAPQPMPYASPGLNVYHATVGRGRVARVLLMIIIALDVAGIGITLYDLTLPPDAYENDQVPLPFLLAIVLWGLLYVGIYIASAIVFCMWMYRAHANLPALGRDDLDYTSGWAAGAWFVPILNLIRPFRIMKEIYKASAPRGGGGTTTAAWKHAPDPPMLNWWWAAWIISNVMTNISMRMELRGDASVQRAGLFVDLCSVPIGIAAAWLAIAITRRIDEMQADRYAAPAQQPYETPLPYATPQYYGRYPS